MEDKTERQAQAIVDALKKRPELREAVADLLNRRDAIDWLFEEQDPEPTPLVVGPDTPMSDERVRTLFDTLFGLGGSGLPAGG